MAVDPLFNTKLAEVDAARSFNFIADPTYGENEWSVDGWDVRHGSEEAGEQGAGEALYAMDFRFATPGKVYMPPTVPALGVTLTKQEFALPFGGMFYNYGLANSEPITTLFNEWRTLNCINDGRMPHGHHWQSAVSGIEAQDGFFSANPSYYTGTIGSTGASFNMALTGADYNALVDRVAAYELGRLNAYNRASFDPQDGSPWSSDQVFGFARDVVAKMRETVPGAQLGIYGYFNHGQPVSFQCPGIYVQWATAFNTTNLNNDEAIEQWGQVCDAVGIRGYGDIMAWEGFRAGTARWEARDYIKNSFERWIPMGVNHCLIETSGNGTKNIIGHYNGIRCFRSGVGDYEAVLNDFLPKFYGNDSNVADLFNLWSNKGFYTNLTLYRRSCEIVDAMPDTDYRAEFRRYLALCMLNQRLRSLDNAINLRRLEQQGRWVQGMRDTGEIQSYAFLRRFIDDSDVDPQGRPDLAWDQSPHYSRFRAAPTEAEYATERDANNEFLADRPAYMDEEFNEDNLVLVDTGSSAGRATWMEIQKAGAIPRWWFVGPGTVTVTQGRDSGALISQTTYGPGLHTFTTAALRVVECDTGYLFCEWRWQYSPEATGGNTYVWVPHAYAGRTIAWSTGNLRLGGQVIQGRQQFAEGPTRDPRNLLPGLRSNDNATRNDQFNINLNPFVAFDSSKMLMPRALAELEFPNRAIARAA